MATATSALATLAPYQPPDGLAPREILAHAKEYIDRLTKKHTTLQEKIAVAKQYGGTKLVTFAATGVTTAVSAALGFFNGRYGGDKGYVAPYGIPIDLTASAIAHVVGMTNVCGDVGSRIVHTAGDSALGVGTYRFTHGKGVEMAARAAAKKAAGAGAGVAPGASPGTSPQNGAGAGPRGGTPYAVPQT
jgi:hypothetical protein